MWFCVSYREILVSRTKYLIEFDKEQAYLQNVSNYAGRFLSSMFQNMMAKYCITRKIIFSYNFLR